MKSTAELITSFEATRQAKQARMNEIMTAAGEKGETLDAEQTAEYDGVVAEVKSIDAHLKRLAEVETLNKAAARAVDGTSAEKASESRGGTNVIRIERNLEPGMEFARYAKCLAVAKGDTQQALAVAQRWYPEDTRVHTVLKDAVSAGTTTDATWAGALVDYTNFAGDFIDFLRPMTIVGKFGMNGVPSLNRVPFNVRIIGQTSGGNADWVGQGAPKPLTKFDFAPTLLTWAKVAGIAVLSDELVRFSSPSADRLVRDALAQAIIARIDTDFIDPDKTASANVSPASITNAVTPIASTGSTAGAIRTDIQALFAPFLAANLTPTNGVWIMSNTVALALSLMRNELGQPEFPGLTMQGGNFQGMPVITSQYAAVGSPVSNLVILLNASDVYLADDGQVVIDASREASLQMLDNPTNNSSTGTPTSMVSMFQTNSVALRAERFINWAVRRPEAVVYMEDVTWGVGGSS